MLTIDNILGGKLEKPKVLLSWRKATLKDMPDKQKWSAAKCASEIQEIEELQAAINLIPLEIGSMADAVVLSSLDRVLPRCPHLPCHVVHSLVRRATEIAIQGRRPYEVV